MADIRTMDINDQDGRYLAVLMDHAAGTLRPSAAYVVDAHLALHEPARRLTETFDCLGGSLLDEIAPVPLETAFMLADAGGPDRAIGPAMPATAPQSVLLPSLLSAVGAGAWKRGLAGTLTKPVPGLEAQLLKVPQGRSVPEHGHRGLELTLVLAGCLRDETGTFGRGALLVHDEATEHTPMAMSGSDCICLIAEEAPVRLKGPLGLAHNLMVALGGR